MLLEIRVNPAEMDPVAMDSVEMDSVLTVILVNYKSLANIEATLRSGALGNHAVIVVDNGDDPDGVVATCEKYGATALLADRNLGFAAAVNLAVASVDRPVGPWLLLNPDVEVSEAQLAGLVQQLADGVDGVAPLLADDSGLLQIGPGGGPMRLWSVAAYFLFVSHVIPSVRGVFLTRGQSRRTREVSWLCMACLVLAPDAFARFGPIPDNELVYAEDLAWGTLATEAGARFVLDSSISVRHDQGASGSSARWIGAFERLCRARLGRFRGAMAVAAFRLGLAIRRLLGRSVR
jgi:N-acetylglucosaminyl-diphospho-decaprenol L-rhamnosyltransferase